MNDEPGTPETPNPATVSAVLDLIQDLPEKQMNAAADLESKAWQSLTVASLAVTFTATVGDP